MRPRPCLWLLPALLVLALGCNESTEPTVGLVDGTSEGRIDPRAGDFVLEAVDVPLPEGPPLHVELVGRDLVLDEDGEHLELIVALRNRSDRLLPAPVVVWLHRFEPPGVFVANPDTSLPAMSILPVDGYVYVGEVAPGETSPGKTWRFCAPDQESFSFAVRIEPGLPPARPTIEGVCFVDLDRDGRPDPNEPPLVPGIVHVTDPLGNRHLVELADEFRFVYWIESEGLHEVTWLQAPEVFADLEFTTPNPRHVLISTGPDGVPRGFHEADVGAFPRMPSIQFTERPLAGLHFAPWSLLEATVVEHRILAPRVAFSGCEPGLRFSLWTNGDFMESDPVQVDMVLVHDLDEDCGIAFEGGYMFDLEPLIQSYREAYSHGELMMNLIDFAGERHPIRLEIPLEKHGG